MALIETVKNWRPKTPFYYGWLVLGVAAMGTYVATGAAQVVLGGIQSLIFEDMGWDRSTIAFAVTAGTWTSGFVSPFVGRLADKHGPRGIMPIAALVVGICYFALAGIQSVWQFYAAYIIARAIANPILVGVVPRTVCVNFFQRRRNLALGFTSMARPFAGAINIQLISLIAQFFSWRAGYRYLGVLSLVMIVPLLLIMRRRPEDIGLRPDGDPPEDEDQGLAVGARPRRPARARQFDWRASEAVMTTTFLFIVIAQILEILTSGAIGFQIVPFLQDSGMSLALAAGALSLSSMLGALSNPVLGALADRFNPRTMALAIVIVACVVTGLLLVEWPLPIRFVVLILWGTFSGGLGVLTSMMLAHYFGRTSYGTITGIIGPFQTGALGLGPTFGALLFNFTGGYSALFIFGVAAYVAAFVGILSVRTPKLPARASAGPNPGGEG
jgi:MFS family permease